MAAKLGIPFIVLADYDIREIKEDWAEKRRSDEKERNKKHKAWNQAILDVAGAERTFFLTPNFEAALGLSGEESQKVDQAMTVFDSAAKEDIPQCLKAPVNALMRTAASSSAHPTAPAGSSEVFPG